MNSVRVAEEYWADAGDEQRTEACEECEGQGGYWLHTWESALTGDAPEIWETCRDCHGAGTLPCGQGRRR